jgi:DNA-binding transcriptional LysR family regulator
VPALLTAASRRPKRATHPKLKIDLRLADGFVDLVEQGIDISVRIGELEDSSLVARRVGTTRRTLLAHRSYLRSLPRGRKAPKTLEDLADHNCIVYTESSPRNSWTFQSAEGARRTIRVDGNLQTNSSVVIRAAVLAGMGIAYAPTWVFEDELQRGELVQLIPEWQGVPLPISLVSPPERKHSAKVKAFAEHMGQGLS